VVIDFAPGRIGDWSRSTARRWSDESEVPVNSITSVNGEELYAHYCAVCHGKEGRGNGPAAVALKPLPTDLTQIARKNGGRFPTLGIRESITNNDGIAGHGTKAMPVWGTLLVPSSDEGPLGTLRIHNLTTYIEGLQR
jgi:mono/diheme cytochrome c family protein